MRWAWLLMAMAGLAGVPGGCQPPRAREGGFDSADPAAKLYAIHRAGQQRDTAAIGHLIEQLNSDDPAVRMYAITALQRITGQRLGYDPYAPAYRRQIAIDRWAQAWRQGRFNAAATAPAEPHTDQPQADTP